MVDCIIQPVAVLYQETPFLALTLRTLRMALNDVDIRL